MKRERPCWISGKMFAKLTGMNAKEMMKFRKLNPHTFTVIENSIVYNANLIPESLKKAS